MEYQKIAFLFILSFLSQPFALTLDQVKTALREKSVPRDSVEMNIRVSVKASGVFQQSEIYMVNKGAAKSYTEIKSSLLNQRCIVNGNKMKIVDLKTKKTRVLDYNGDLLKSDSYAKFNPLDSGEWNEPKLLSGDVYTIQGSAGTLYYNNKMKRVEKIEAEKDRANTLTTFTYDANNQMKKMTVSVIVNGIESVVTTEILRMQKSDKAPDSLFDF